jgi:small subunit ribosomal protein S15
MSMTSEQKSRVIKDFQSSQQDTGSTEVQVALLSARIEELGGHFQSHPHDVHSRMGLLRMVNKRRRLLDYLKRTDSERYRSLISRLGLRK